MHQQMMANKFDDKRRRINKWFEREVKREREHNDGWDENKEKYLMDCQQTSKSIIILNEFYDCEAMWEVLMKRVI